MERTIKFIWDYFGPPASKTASHHSEHLLEFAEARDLSIQQTGYEELKENRAIAFILLPEKDAVEFKDILRPHRAEIAKED
ncbi:MAG TPA: hypothetical protein VK021_02220 [Flavobacteriaceae bacterium]|nr:hypothetical protein [Flavobacteriaceae bacterium]